MSTSLSVHAGAAWHTATKVFAKAGGVWRDCVAVYVRSGGSWHQVFSSTIATLTGANFTAELYGSQGVTSVHFSSNGAVNTTGGSNGFWAAPLQTGFGSDYYVRMTIGAGNGNMNGTFGSWVSLAVGSTWSMAAAGFSQLRQRSVGYEISVDQSTILATGLLTFTNDSGA